jgi:hypothetical protein
VSRLGKGGRVLPLLLLFAAVALSACYASNRLLLDPDAAAHPLDDGVYERSDAEHQRIRLSRTPDGWYSVEDVNANGTIGQTRRALFNDMPLGGLKAYAVAEETADGWIYGVVVQANERVYLATPDCADPLDASVAVDHGGVQADDDAMTHNCLFKDPGALIAALSAYAGQAEFGAPYLKK